MRSLASAALFCQHLSKYTDLAGRQRADEKPHRHRLKVSSSETELVSATRVELLRENSDITYRLFDTLTTYKSENSVMLEYRRASTPG